MRSTHPTPHPRWLQLRTLREVLPQVYPSFPPAFWALLIVLTSVLLVPLALARAAATNGLDIAVLQIATLIAGNVVCFGFMAQSLTLRLFWREVGPGARGWALARPGT